MDQDEQVNIENQDQFEDSLPDVKRFVHFDLSAAPPNINYLRKVFQLLSEMDASGIFLEYEASFPFEDDLSLLANGKRSYTQLEAAEIETIANEFNLEIVPVIDICTNAFYITKHFQQLRVRKDCLMDLNPMLDETKNFVNKIIASLMKVHRTPGWIHLGCEKFESLNNNFLAAEIRTKNTTADLVYLDYIEAIAAHVKSIYPSVRPLIWDDMMRKIKPEVLMEHKAPDYFDVVIRGEENGVSQDARSILKLIQRHGKIFDGLWLASNYKCGKDPIETLPDVRRNALQAEEIFQAAKSAPVYANIMGFVITGPSRWTHFAAMCSLLPAALPSLITSFITTTRGTFSSSVLWEASRKLGFQMLIPIVYKPRPQEVIPGSFPGSEVWRSTQLIENTKGRIHSFIDGPNFNSFFNKYLIKSGRVSYFRLETIDTTLDTLIKDLNMTRTSLVESMSEIYPPDVINEWVIEQVATEQRTLNEAKVSVTSHLASLKTKV